MMKENAEDESHFQQLSVPGIVPNTSHALRLMFFTRTLVKNTGDRYYYFH